MSTPPSVAPLELVLERRLSADRLGPYRAARQGDLGNAIALYRWNAEVSAAFMETLGYLEVILRNALHDQLAAWHANRQRPGEWFDDPAQVLLQHRRTDIAEAKRRITLAGRPLAPGRMVAELTFGFWRFLLDRRCQNTLWAPALRHAFPNLVPQRRVDVYNPIDRLLRVRNRIAHHEPVHYLPLEARYDDVLEILGFIDSAVQGWVAAGSRVPAVLATKP